MRAAVIVFPGSNCDRDLAVALKAGLGAEVPYVWHKETELPQGLDLIGVPGGFSYGDYLRCGAIAAQSPIMWEVARFARSGGYVLGICNGFQVLQEAELLPGALMRNAGLNFVHRDVNLRVETEQGPFTAAANRGDVLQMPVAHHDGNFFADANVLDRLEAEDRVAFRYCDEVGDTTKDANPNGSIDNIAGIMSENRRVLGMMPHPERATDPQLGGIDGELIFRSLQTQATAAA